MLYVAAHPDDENTRMISYFSNHKHYHTTYLSLTRGDGGQNLIGSEISDLLGLIRTQELIAARKLDGGNQLFSRARDFGYSKHSDETMEIWNKDEVLSDVVWAIRKTRPDIIINRFDHRTPGSTHGHHTASAILAEDAMAISGDASVYPQQLDHVTPWSPSRLFFNTHWWFYGSREKFEEADKSKLASVDIGVFYPLKGQSNNEIAAASRSMHKSQGFGSTGSRGSEIEYAEILQGSQPQNDPMDGINTTWSRLNGGDKVAFLLKDIEQSFDLENPAASIPELMKAYEAILTLENDGFWVPLKLAELKDVIYHCGGLFVEAVAGDFSAAPGGNLQMDVEAISRLSDGIKLLEFGIKGTNLDTSLVLDMGVNQGYSWKFNLNLHEDLPFSGPYWLKEEGTLGMFDVQDQTLRGLPESPPALSLDYTLEISGHQLNHSTPVVHKMNDPVKGEVYRPFEISPRAYLNFTDDLYVFASQTPRPIQVLVIANTKDLDGTVKIAAAKGWEVEPRQHEISLDAKGEETLVEFMVLPPADPSEENLSLVFEFADGSTSDQAVTFVKYDHIPVQTILKPAEAKVVKLDLHITGRTIGYLMGAGDDIPSYLEQIGYDVHLLEDADFTNAGLEKYDAIVTGIRAYNTNDRIGFQQTKLLEYVEAGGTLVVQYNTSRGLKTENIGPFPLSLSRDRVTVEEAPVRILAPDHPVVNIPNKITEGDFEGWVQERGLYFADEWDEQYTPILSSNDPGEPPRDGGLLVANYGKGTYIYCGYSWFRQLPAGVPGAYRILANLISNGKHAEP